MKYFLFLAALCFLNISCRTDTNINDISMGNYINHVDIYLITSPAAGDIWDPGSTRKIKWTSNMNQNPVDIYVIKKKAYNETIIAKGSPNNGSYTWFLPQDIALSNHYQIKIVESGNEANIAYSEVFFIR